MRTREEIYSNFAELIQSIRTDAKLSRSKFAAELGIDEHTLARWENGKSCPSVVDFILICEKFGSNALRKTLNITNPDLFQTIESAEQARNAITHYFNNTSSDATSIQAAYVLLGNHGSSIDAQMNMFAILDHLSLEYRLIVAKLILNLWEVANIRGGIINTDGTMPNAELLRSAIIQSQLAVANGKDSYTLL